jgi:hypothetical protein
LFVAVPATAGQVIVAVPLVEPLPVMTQEVVPVTPQLSAEKSPMPRVVPPIVPGAANVAPPSVLALFVPVPLKVSEEPDPSTPAMLVFVPDVSAEKAGACSEVSVTPESCTACPPAPVMTSPLVLLAAWDAHVAHETAGVVPPLDTIGEVPVTEVTPPALGAAHVPSPRQNVVLEALVPLFRLVTGRLPVTPVVNGRPVALVRTPDAGVPSAGVTSVGLVARTRFPVPV